LLILTGKRFQIAITSTDKRQSYLDPMGMNYKQLENDFF